MKRIIGTILIVAVLFSNAMLGKCEEAQSVNLEDIVEINITRRHWSSGTSLDYTTSDKNTIDFLMWFLDNMELSESNRSSTGTEEIFITLVNSAGEKVIFMTDGHYNMFVIIPQIEQLFCFKEEEFDYFLDRVTAIDKGEYVIDEKTMQAPSDWAKATVERAEAENLVPVFNRIGYRNSITRLDVCEIIEQFLFEHGYEKKIFDFHRKFYYDMGGPNTERRSWEIMTKEEVSDYDWKLYPEMQRLRRDNLFEDCDRRSVVILRALGIIDGMEDNKFYPNNMITREELAKIISNLWHYLNDDVLINAEEAEYNDYDEISDWAKVYVDEMSEIGVFKGTDSGDFEPKRNMTGEEVVVVLMRLFSAIQ